MTTEARAEIRRRLAECRGILTTEVVEAMFIGTCEDLIVGAGLDPVRVQASLLRAWVIMLTAERGAVSTAELLRDFADLTERSAVNPQDWELRH